MMACVPPPHLANLAAAQGIAIRSADEWPDLWPDLWAIKGPAGKD